MTTATLTAPTGRALLAHIAGIAHSFSLAMRYKHLFQLSDHELARRGLNPDALRAQFIKEAGAA